VDEICRVDCVGVGATLGCSLRPLEDDLVGAAVETGAESS